MGVPPSIAKPPKPTECTPPNNKQQGREVDGVPHKHVEGAEQKSPERVQLVCVSPTTHPNGHAELN